MEPTEKSRERGGGGREEGGDWADVAGVNASVLKAAPTYIMPNEVFFALHDAPGGHSNGHHLVLGLGCPVRDGVTHMLGHA